jgi:hypothetical protein
VGASCGYYFGLGETYLVYAGRSGEKEVSFSAGLCSRIRYPSHGEFKEDVRVLDKLTPEQRAKPSVPLRLPEMED